MNYIFNTTTEITSGKVNIDRLQLEISQSAISGTLERIDLTGSVLTVVYGSTLTLEDLAVLNAIVLNHSGEEIVEVVAPTEVSITGKTAIQGAIPVVNYKPEDSSFTLATHDFCDKCTWYSNSIRVENEVAITENDIEYFAGQGYFINVRDGVVNRQDLHQDKAVIVKINDVVVDDYILDHVEGSVTFPTAQTGNTIKISYNYATNSEWIMTPEPGKLLIIEHSEVQFSQDVVINTPLRFEIWVGNPYYATVGHPYEGMPKIPYSHIQYNSIRDLVNEANLGTGYIPQMGDLPGNILVFPFNYVSVKPFQSSVGAELRIKSVDDKELTGSYGTATFYLISRVDE